MITRIYKCKCGFRKEVQVSIKDDIEKVCPECSGGLFQDLKNDNSAMLFDSKYFYNGKFNRHPRVTGVTHEKWHGANF